MIQFSSISFFRIFCSHFMRRRNREIGTKEALVTGQSIFHCHFIRWIRFSFILLKLHNRQQAKIKCIFPISGSLFLILIRIFSNFFFFLLSHKLLTHRRTKKKWIFLFIEKKRKKHKKRDETFLFFNDVLKTSKET